MKNLTLALALFAASATAAPMDPTAVRNMVGQSEAVMYGGLCSVANDTADYGSDVVLVMLPPPVGARRILKNTYNRMRNLGYLLATPSSDAARPPMRFAMSQWIYEKCSADGLSDECLAARAFWSQSPVAVRPPANGVPITSVGGAAPNRP